VSRAFDRAELEAALRRIGEERYHDKHPFHVLMMRGVSPRASCSLVLNRFYYQKRFR